MNIEGGEDYFDDDFSKFNMPAFRCGECNQEFPSANALSDHVNVVHTDATKVTKTDQNAPDGNVEVKTEPIGDNSSGGAPQDNNALDKETTASQDEDVKLEQIKVEDMVDEILETPEVVTALKEEAGKTIAFYLRMTVVSFAFVYILTDTMNNFIDDSNYYDYDQEEEEEDPDFMASSSKKRRKNYDNLSCEKCCKVFKNRRGLRSHRCEISHSCDICGRVR